MTATAHRLSALFAAMAVELAAARRNVNAGTRIVGTVLFTTKESR